MTTTPTGRTRLAACVAAEIRAEMARRNITQRRLARDLDVIEAWLSRRLHGHVTMNLDDLDQIATEIGVPAIELLRRADQSRGRPSAFEIGLGYRSPAGGPRRPLRIHTRAVRMAA